MPAEEKKSSWKFQSDDIRWGVEKNGTLSSTLFCPPLPKLIQDDFRISQILQRVSMCVCVCVCSVAAWTKVAMLQNSSSNIQKWFHYENDLKRRQAMEQVKPNSTRVYTQLGSTEPNWTENRKENGEEGKQNNMGKGRIQLNSAPSPHRDTFAFWCTNSMTFSQLIVVITLLRIPCKYPTYVLICWENGWLRAYTILNLLCWVNLFNL